MKYLVILLISVSFLSCKENKKKFNATCNQVSLDAQIDSLLEVFMTENKNVGYQYFLITYLSCDERIVTFIANNMGMNYYNRRKSLFYFIKNDQKIYLITGIEDFFKKNTEADYETKEREKSPFSTIKSYTIYHNKIEFVPNGIPPFAPPPSPEVK